LLIESTPGVFYYSLPLLPETSKDVSSLSGGGSWGSRYCNLDCVGFSVVVRSLTNSHVQLPFPLVYLPLTSPQEKKSTIQLPLLLPAKHLPPLPPRCCALDAFGDGDCSPLRHLAVGVCRGTCSAHQHWQNTPSIQFEMALPVSYSSYPQLVSPRQAATRGDRPGSSSLVITHLPQSWRTFVNAQVTWVCDCTLDHVALHLLPKFHTLKALVIIPICNSEVGHRTPAAVVVVPPSTIPRRPLSFWPSRHQSFCPFLNQPALAALLQWAEVEYWPSPHLRLPGPPLTRQQGVLLHEAVFLMLHHYHISFNEYRHFPYLIYSRQRLLH
ncbi:hypothetical protein B296_00029357, partial [Ensete ventricosum]